MGSGIAQAAAMAGHDVQLVDVGDNELARGTAAIDSSLSRLERSGRIGVEESEAARARVQTSTDLCTAVSGSSVVIEAVPEILEVKRTVLGRAASAAPRDAVLGTNTSQLSISAIGSELGEAARRLIGTHFFNPPVLMKLVELIRSEMTSDDTLARAVAFATSLGKEVVICRRDSPGFITSRAYAAFRLECIRILEDDVATVEDIDKALKLAFNLPMGPFELADFNGLDTYLHALTGLERAYGKRFEPPEVLKQLVATGRLGRKTGAGFYQYGDDGERMANAGDVR
jgi:3-hydroxybutyryl-CoA dehydrogenase